MIRNTIDVFLSGIDRERVRLAFHVWFVTFLTVGGNVAVTGAGHDPWSPTTFLIVWLVIFIGQEGIAGFLSVCFAILVSDRWLAWGAGRPGDILLPPEARGANRAEQDELTAFWDSLLDDGGGWDDD